jgi:hypothetical protein
MEVNCARRQPGYVLSSSNRPAPVTSLDARLFAWHRVKLQYEASRALLREAMDASADEPTLAALNGEADRLRKEMSMLLNQLDAARRERAQRDASPG